MSLEELCVNAVNAARDEYAEMIAELPKFVEMVHRANRLAFAIRSLENTNEFAPSTLQHEDHIQKLSTVLSKMGLR